MRIGFETTVNACDAAAVTSAGVAAVDAAAGPLVSAYPVSRLDETAARVPDMC